jgi:hypothetical protein
MKVSATQRIWLAALLFTSSIFLFAWLVPSAMPVKLIAIAVLAIPVIVVYQHTLHLQEIGGIWSSPATITRRISSITVGIALGVFVGMKYRLSIGMTALPQQLFSFAMVAAAIGATEEIIFRGVLPWLLHKQTAVLTILFTSVAHAGYKTILFLSPFTTQQVDTWHLFSYTFLSGLVLGTLKHFGKTTAAPLLAHVGWDVVVYGDSIAAPWWVW